MIVVLAMMLAGAPVLPMALLPAPQFAAPPPLVGPDCQRLLASSPGPGIAQLCQAESEMRTSESASLDPAERQRRFATAAATFDAASAVLREPALKIYAFEAAARLFDSHHLNEPPRREQALRSLVPLMPGNSSPLRRVAQLQEEQGLIDAAENTLLDAKLQAPEDVEIYRALSHFFTRRGVQISTDASSRAERENGRAPGPGEPDADGYYSVGGNVSRPAPISTPFPERPSAAAAAGVGGLVVLEVCLDEWGSVSDAKILQSVPMLDDAVLAALRTWRYTPSMLDGRAVPVKMTVTVNFPPAAR